MSWGMLPVVLSVLGALKCAWRWLTEPCARVRRQRTDSRGVADALQPPVSSLWKLMQRTEQAHTKGAT